MSNYEVIKQAIQNRKCVTCDYNGYQRKMTPHVLGTKNGTEQALFYQYAGDSSTGLSSDASKNWRCIPVNKIKNLTVNNDPFQTAQNHSKAQSCVDDIDVEVKY